MFLEVRGPMTSGARPRADSSHFGYGCYVPGTLLRINWEALLRRGSPWAWFTVDVDMVQQQGCPAGVHVWHPSTTCGVVVLASISIEVWGTSSTRELCMVADSDDLVTRWVTKGTLSELFDVVARPTGPGTPR